MSKEVFIKWLNIKTDVLAPTEEACDTSEIVAEEHMYIIGTIMKPADAHGTSSWLVMSRSGISCWLESAQYEEIIDKFGVLAYCFARTDMQSSGIHNAHNTFCMLPFGCYFLLEKQERLYFHGKFRNNDDAANIYAHAYLGILYTKTKP